MLGVNYNKSPIGNDDIEMEYDDGELEVIELRDYELTRERLGATTNLDYRFSNSSRIFGNASYNYFADDQIRRITLLEADEVLREFSDRLEENQIFSSSFGGEHRIGGGFNIDYRVSYSYSDQVKPFGREVIYAQAWEDESGDDIDFIGFDRSDTDFPRFALTNEAPPGAGVYNYSAFEFDEYVESSSSTSDQHFTTRINLSKNYVLSDNITGTLKFGGVGRFKSKDQDVTENVYDYDGDLTFEDLLGTFEDSDYLLGKYSQGMGLFPSRSNLRSFLDNNRSDFELEDDDSIEASNAEDYDATEDTYAGYIMTNLRSGRLETVLGVRYEQVVSQYNGNIVEYDDDEELQLSTASDKNSFDFFLPMVHLKYSLLDNANLRFAWTNTFSKPSYFALVPYRIISRPDEEIELGNPDLLPCKGHEP
jgi:outer membrane receptor protein involved in Fe transport